MQIMLVKEYIRRYIGKFYCKRTSMSFLTTYFNFNRAYKGKTVTLIVRIPMQNRQSEDIEVVTHTNDTIGSIRRQVYSKLVFL